MKNKKKSNYKHKFKTAFVLLLIFSVIFIVFNFFRTNIASTVYAYSESKVRALSVKAVNNAVSELIKNKNIYDNLVNVSTDMEGKITAIQANSTQINMLTEDLIKTSQLKLENIGAEGIDIPIGTFSGLNILNGKGPSINISLIPIGDVTCEFFSEFISSGINQTLHRLYVSVNTNVNIILPLTNNNVKTQTNILICESILMGKVPEVYLNSSKLDEKLNLVP